MPRISHLTKNKYRQDLAGLARVQDLAALARVPQPCAVHSPAAAAVRYQRRSDGRRATQGHRPPTSRAAPPALAPAQGAPPTQSSSNKAGRDSEKAGESGEQRQGWTESGKRVSGNAVFSLIRDTSSYSDADRGEGICPASRNESRHYFLRNIFNG